MYFGYSRRLAHIPSLYARSAQKDQWGFTFDYMRDMQRIVDDCNRRIDSAQRRLEKTPDEIRQTNALVCHVILHSLSSPYDNYIDTNTCA